MNMAPLSEEEQKLLKHILEDRIMKEVRLQNLCDRMKAPERKQESIHCVALINHIISCIL